MNVKKKVDMPKTPKKEAFLRESIESLKIKKDIKTNKIKM